MSIKIDKFILFDIIKLINIGNNYIENFKSFCFLVYFVYFYINIKIYLQEIMYVILEIYGNFVL